tara:strand:+ start:214 stop:645 length:432 start_codon:yes stop_codon:yes gene_type:complete
MNSGQQETGQQETGQHEEVLHYELKEPNYSITDNSNKNEIDNLLNNESFFSDFKEEYEYFDDDNLIAQHVDYYENYNIKMLKHIATYYNILKRKYNKSQIIDEIIQFENNSQNSLMVYNRKRFWHYITELKNDSFFSKYVIFN